MLRVAETKVCVRERQEGRKREGEKERWAIERERHREKVGESDKDSERSRWGVSEK